MSGNENEEVLSSYKGCHADSNIDIVRRTLAEDPDNDLLKDWLALNLYQAERFAEAALLYEEILAKSKGTPDQHYYLGNCHYALGNLEAACRLWQEVIEMDPSSKTAQKVIRKLQKLSDKEAA